MPGCTERRPAALAGAALWVLLGGGVHGYEDGAPPAHTGAFGEPDCSACHFDFPKNEPPGRLEVRGLPSAPQDGVRYLIEVLLEHPELASGGFQAAFRTPDGAPAGELDAPSPATGIVEQDGRAYVQHSRAGRAPTAPGRIRWTFSWCAPRGEKPVVVAIAANAANDDRSALGDRIYTLTLTLARDGGTRDEP